MKLDIAAERARLQAMRDNPQTDLEREFKVDVLDNGSEPREWSDETISSAHYMFRVYAMGWCAAMRDTPPATGAAKKDDRSCLRYATSHAIDACSQRIELCPQPERGKS